MYIAREPEKLRINRYIVGCKSNIALGAIGGAVGINRYIVGCKYFLICCVRAVILRINRYIVGCK